MIIRDAAGIFWAGLFILGALATARESESQAFASSPMGSAASLLAACTGDAAKSDAEKMQLELKCQYYLAGSLDTYAFIQTSVVPIAQYCWYGGLSTSLAKPIIIKFLQENPAILKDEQITAEAAIFLAMRDKFPCEKVK